MSKSFRNYITVGEFFGNEIGAWNSMRGGYNAEELQKIKSEVIKLPPLQSILLEIPSKRFAPKNYPR